MHKGTNTEDKSLTLDLLSFDLLTISLLGTPDKYLYENNLVIYKKKMQTLKCFVPLWFYSQVQSSVATKNG